MLDSIRFFSNLKPQFEDEMTFTVLYSKIKDPSSESGYYYAHIPALDLTTHGVGIDGAKSAAIDLLKLWIEEKIASGEEITVDDDFLYSKIEMTNALSA
jgi:predicted RNase H-like HicB family nuclease